MCDRASTLSRGAFGTGADAVRGGVVGADSMIAKADSAAADGIIADKRTRLSAVAERGTIFGQFLTDVDYRSEAGQTVTISLVPGEQVEDGQRTKSAEIRVRTVDGWETIIPASGLTACMPADAGY